MSSLADCINPANETPNGKAARFVQYYKDDRVVQRLVKYETGQTIPLGRIAMMRQATQCGLGMKTREGYLNAGTVETRMKARKSNDKFAKAILKAARK